jgi:hypothetical protein
VAAMLEVNDTLDFHRVEKLMNDHWNYIQSLLTFFTSDPEFLRSIELYYKDAFYQGYIFMESERDYLHGLFVSSHETSEQEAKLFLFVYDTAYVHGKKHRLQAEGVM